MHLLLLRLLSVVKFYFLNLKHCIVRYIFSTIPVTSDKNTLRFHLHKNRYLQIDYLIIYFFPISTEKQNPHLVTIPKQ